MQRNPVPLLNSPAELLRTYREGNIADAERMARAILAVHPNEALATNVLGLCLLASRRMGEAVNVFGILTQRHPQEASYWGNLGLALRAEGRLREAERASQEAVRLQPRHAGFLANLGFLQIELRRIVLARDLLWRASQLDPTDYEVRIYGAQMCLECGDEARAAQMVEGWQSWAPTLDGVLGVELAALLMRMGSDEEGEALLRSYLEDPVSGEMARARLILVLERFNRLDEAHALLAHLSPPEQIADPALRSEVLEANAMLAARGKDIARALSLFDKLLADPASARRQVEARFVLAKLCDKQGDYDACMKNLQLAHTGQMEIVCQLMPELAEPGSNPLNIAKFHVEPEQFRAWKPVAAPPVEASPIFVVGFPRSGTTMLEQMLDAHPDMVSMDERPFIQRVIERMQSMGMQYPEQLGELDSEQCASLRETYWDAVKTVVEIRPGQRLVDKNPLTMLRLPLLARLFPNARIIFAVRHPCDVVLSNYMQHFTAPAFSALCSTLPRLAGGYTAAMRFWTDHAALLNPFVFEWRYESAIADLEGNAEKLGAFLELQDVAAMYDFSEHAKRKGYIGTPSYAQVTQPVYAGSVGRWQKYRNYFEPILPILEPALKHWHYDN